MRRLGRYVICDSDEFERLTDIADKRRTMLDELAEL